MSRRYTDARILRDDIKNKMVPETVIIEVTTELLAGFLGQRFTGPDGRTVSMEQVDIAYDAHFERSVASPLVVEVSRGPNPFANPAVD